MRRYYDDDEDDPYAPETLEDLADALEDVERAQRLLAHYQKAFNRMLRAHPEFKQKWDKFQRAGGVTSDEFRDFLRGRMRPRIRQGKKHLRLVSSKVRRKVSPGWQDRPTSHDDDAA